MTGKVKWFNVHKRFGYIEGEDGQDHFVHASGISDGRTYTGLNDNDLVEFELVQGKKGTQAANVRLIKETKETTAAPTE